MLDFYVKFLGIQLDLRTWKRCIVMMADCEEVSLDMVLVVREDVPNGTLAKCRLQGPWY